VRPADIETAKLKTFSIGCAIGIVLAMLGVLLGYNVSGFEAAVIVIASGVASVWWRQ
jgi:hypothetical protein